jgi:hypothetical protein
MRIRISLVAALLILGSSFLSAEPVYKWAVTVDPITDVVKLSLQADSDDGGNSWEPAELWIGSDKDSVEIWTYWFRTFESNAVQIISRVDKSTPITATWPVENSKWLDFPTDSDLKTPEDFLKALLASKTLALRFSYAAGGSRTAVFSTTGLADVARPYKDLLSWGSLIPKK